jgi:hypothetical protein
MTTNYLENIQTLIDKLDLSATLTLTASKEFISNPAVFSPKAQLPDLLVKTRLPFDKNQCFWTKRKGSFKTYKNLFPR